MNVFKIMWVVTKVVVPTILLALFPALIVACIFTAILIGSVNFYGDGGGWWIWFISVPAMFVTLVGGVVSLIAVVLKYIVRFFVGAVDELLAIKAVDL